MPTVFEAIGIPLTTTADKEPATMAKIRIQLSRAARNTWFVGGAS